MLSRLEIDAALVVLELELPFLRENPSVLNELFEDRIELLMADVAASDEVYALERIKTMVDRVGIYR